MRHRAINFASAAFFVTSLALASDTWILDSNRSNARLFQGSGANSDSVSTGVARVTGKVKLDTNDLDSSFFELSIYPADENWGYALSSEGTLPTGYALDATDQTMLTFKSACILMTRDGKLEVIGDLTLTRVERSVTARKIGNHAGPAYSDPVIHNETREIRFLFPSVSAEHLSPPLTPAMQQKIGVLEIVGSGRIDRDEFSELLSAIKESNWPTVVKNSDRRMPSTVDQDCEVATCTGTLVEATRYDDCQGPEHYSAPQCSAVIGNETTIVLDLKFLHPVHKPSVGMLS